VLNLQIIIAEFIKEKERHSVEFSTAIDIRLIWQILFWDDLSAVLL